MMQPAQDLLYLDVARFEWLDWARHRTVLLKPQVRPTPVIVVQVVAEH